MILLADTAQFALTGIQRQAATDSPGKLVFLGGPGAGKSLVVAERAVWLVASGIARPDDILVLAPSRRAAVAIGAHIRERLPNTPTPAATSFHGLALTALRRYYRLMGYQQAPQILSTTRHFHILRQMLLEEDPALWPHYHGSLGTGTLQKLAYDLVMGAAQNGLDLAELLRRVRRGGRADLAELAEFYPRYRQRQRQAGLVDFGDLLASLVEMLSSRPDVAQTYRRTYRHILVDEFEEANYAQAEILYRLTDEKTDLLVAGDPEQAINAFRSGSASFLLDCAKRFNARVITSPETFGRSSSVMGAQEDIRPTTYPPFPGEKAGLGSDGDGHKAGCVVLQPFAYTTDEARWVAEMVDGLLRAGTLPGQIAVLFRSLSTPLAQLISAEFIRRGIPCGFQLSRSITASSLVAATVDVLRHLVGQEGSDAAFVRALSSPLAGLPPFGFQEIGRAAALAKVDLAKLASDDSAREALQIGENLRTALTSFLDRLTILQPKLEGGVANLLWEVWRLFPAFHQDALSGGQGSALYAIFLNEITSLQERMPSLRTADLLELMDRGYFDHLSSVASRQGGVTITTVHQAKGQHWDVVFLPGLVEGTWPLRLSPLDIVGHLVARDWMPPPGLAPETGNFGFVSQRLARHLAEEKRVFYVATSRACQSLYLSFSRHAADATSSELPSRFLDSLAGRAGVDAMPDGETERLPADLNGAVVHYRRLLASDTPLRQAQALYALQQMRKWWPEAVRAEEWWSTVRETEGTAPPFPTGKLNLSASQLGNYRDCPLSYQFGYHWKLREPEGAALTIGNLLHSILEEYHRPGSSLPRSREALDGLLQRHFDENAFRYRPVARQARKALGEMLDAYFDHFGLLKGVIEVEKRFSFAFGPHTVRGFIDRIDRLSSRELELVDYKTGGPMTKAEAEDNLQLALYDLAFHEDEDLRALGSPAKVSYLFVKSIGRRADGKRSHAPTDDSRALLKEKIAYFAGGILRESFPSRFSLAQAFPDLDPAELDRALRNNPCRFCAFEWICPEMEKSKI